MPTVVKRAQSSDEMEGLRTLRLKVFVGEQSVPLELEIDDLDDTALHAVALDNGRVVGTGRLIMDGGGLARIGRMAVEKPLRRRGVGSQVLAFLEDEARTWGARRIILHAQNYIKIFYAHHGYREEGDTFMEAGILHVQMFKDLEELQGA